jgi:hypothetical protein
MQREERRQVLISYRTGDTLLPALPEREALLSVMAEFSAAIIEDRPPLTDADAGVRVLSMLEAASLSAASDGARVILADTEPMVAGQFAAAGANG